MEQDDGTEDGPQARGDLPHASGSTFEVFASGGLSLEDFRQNERLKQLEAVEHTEHLASDVTDTSQIEHAARKEFWRNIHLEKDRDDIRAYQTVTDGNGRRGGGRDGRNRPIGDPFPCDSADLLGQIRRKNKRHPKRTSPNRAPGPLQQLIERIVDEGLERIFLQELSAHMKTRAFDDAGLVRHYALLVSEAGFDADNLKPVRDVDDDLTLCAGDNKHTAELLTEFGYPTTVRDVENSNKRLKRSLLDVGTRMFRRMSQAKGSKSDRHGQ